MRRRSTVQLRFMSFVTALVAVFGVAQGAFAATLSVSPASGNYGTGDSFSVKVMVDGGGQPMNAVEAALRFDPAALSVSRVSKDGSVFSLWTAEPTYSNAQGTISFGGGSPTPFTKKSILVDIAFRALKEGSATVSFSSGSVLAADGQGTDILSEKPGGNYSIAAKAAPPHPSPPPSAPAPPTISPLPQAPAIGSPTHKDAEKWYKENSGKMTWPVPDGVSGVRLIFDKNAKAMPKDVSAPAPAEKEFSQLGDGIWYFAAQFQNANGWGAIGRRKIMIDTAPPTSFTIALEKEESPALPAPALVLDAIDEVSGIAQYEISVDGGAPVRVLALELKNKTYTLAGLPNGAHKIVAKAVDAAGNALEADKEITTAGAPPAEQKPKEKNADQTNQTPSYFGLYGWIVIVALFVALAGVIGFSGYQKRRFTDEREKMRKEAQGSVNEISKIFAALREEVEEQINAFDKKPKLSEAEKQILGKLKDALDIAEEFIDKEIEGINKFLR